MELKDFKRLALAGKALFSLKSLKTQLVFNYMISKKRNIWLVYGEGKYMGHIATDLNFYVGDKCEYSFNSDVLVGFKFLWNLQKECEFIEIKETSISE